jgi:hypothetical protein
MLVGLCVTGHTGVPELCLPRAHRTRLCLATLPHWPQESMAKVAHHQHRRCCRCHGLYLATTPATTLLDSLADELLFLVLDHIVPSSCPTSAPRRPPPGRARVLPIRHHPRGRGTHSPQARVAQTSPPDSLPSKLEQASVAPFPLPCSRRRGQCWISSVGKVCIGLPNLMELVLPSLSICHGGFSHGILDVAPP